MKKVFLDTNFIMDLLARGPEYSVPAKGVLEIGVKRGIRFQVSFLTVANLAYILRKESEEKLKENIQLVCSLFDVVPNDKMHLIEALQHGVKDYEDSIQYATAITGGSDCIISRNKKDFRFARIPIYSPAEFIDLC